MRINILHWTWILKLHFEDLLENSIALFPSSSIDIDRHVYYAVLKIRFSIVYLISELVFFAYV